MIARFAIAGACVLAAGAYASRLCPPTNLGGVSIMVIAGILGLVSAFGLIVWCVPRSVARCVNNLRGVMRVPARYQDFVELLGEYYSRLDYTIVLQRSVYESMLADAERTFTHPPRRLSVWKRLMNHLTTPLSSDF